jgi:hypothetical protein
LSVPAHTAKLLSGFILYPFTFVHVVMADNTDDGENIVITVYEPDPEWEADFKRRKAS